MENIFKMIMYSIGGGCTIFGIAVVLLAGYTKLFLNDYEDKEKLSKFELELLYIFG